MTIDEKALAEAGEVFCSVGKEMNWPAALRAAIATYEAACAPERESGWRPIKTAPKNGKTILLYLPGIADCIHTARWAKMMVLWKPEGWWWGDVNITKYNPSHWMPLPKPPITKTEGGSI